MLQKQIRNIKLRVQNREFNITTSNIDVRWTYERFFTPQVSLTGKLLNAGNLRGLRLQIILGFEASIEGSLWEDLISHISSSFIYTPLNTVQVFLAPNPILFGTLASYNPAFPQRLEVSATTFNNLDNGQRVVWTGDIATRSADPEVTAGQVMYVYKLPTPQFPTHNISLSTNLGTDFLRFGSRRTTPGSNLFREDNFVNMIPENEEILTQYNNQIGVFIPRISFRSQNLFGSIPNIFGTHF